MIPLWSPTTSRSAYGSLQSEACRKPDLPFDYTATVHAHDGGIYDLKATDERHTGANSGHCTCCSSTTYSVQQLERQVGAGFRAHYAQERGTVPCVSAVAYVQRMPALETVTRDLW